MRTPSVAVRFFLPAAVLLLVFALRVIDLPHLPPGLSHDEAYNGIAALEVMNGHYRFFYEINKGIEPLIIWLEGWAFQWWGVGPTQLRLVNVLAGLLTVALVYPLTARLFNRRIALLAMTGVAVSFWAIFVSRLTLRAVLLPPGLLLTLYFLWLALKPNSPVNGVTSSAPPRPPHWGGKTKIPPSGGIGGPAPHSPFTPIWFSLSGLFAGITMYTYLSARFVPLIVLAMFGYQWFRGRIGKQHWLGLALFVLVWGVISGPLAAYYWQNAESFLPPRRSGQHHPLRPQRRFWADAASHPAHSGHVHHTGRYHRPLQPRWPPRF
jgi:4-amino-4-deoxy-L-arabinose transferase-like glycosyltransferase